MRTVTVPGLERPQQLGDGRVRDEPSALDDDEPVGDPLQLAHQVARQQHDPALPGTVAQEAAQPHDPFGVEPVHRLVEHEDRRVAEQGGGDAEALPHAERVAADPAAGGTMQTDQVEQLVGAAVGDRSSMQPASAGGDGRSSPR